MTTTRWQKSSYSGASNECIEVRTLEDLIEARESDQPETVLQVPPGIFATLLAAIKAGTFDRHSLPTA
ncbi:DUF397 domain-containing protein [Kitasatospora purpeofusca]|uniref:DUF397 domain-containing protein n=1 Tax=Kitasatospora purpeofusca TaxID=67352 RepID=UPI0036D41829